MLQTLLCSQVHMPVAPVLPEMQDQTSVYWEWLFGVLLLTCSHISNFGILSWIIYKYLLKSLQRKKNLTPWIWMKAYSVGLISELHGVLYHQVCPICQGSLCSKHSLVAHPGSGQLCLLSDHQVYCSIKSTWIQCRVNQGKSHKREREEPKVELVLSNQELLQAILSVEESWITSINEPMNAE